MLGFARTIVFYSGKRSFSCGEKQARGRAVLGVIALACKCSRIEPAVELMVQGHFFSSLMMLCYCVLHMLKHFLHWNCCVQRMCSRVVVRRHSIVFRNSALADRSGMAASRFIVAAPACVILLRFVAKSRKCHIFKFQKLKEASHESFVFTHHGCDLNVRICTKHCVFSGKRSFRCGEKQARERDGLRRRRFSVKSSADCARSRTDGSRRMFLFFDDAVLLCFACYDTLSALELLR